MKVRAAVPSLSISWVQTVVEPKDMKEILARLMRMFNERAIETIVRLAWATMIAILGFLLLKFISSDFSADRFFRVSVAVVCAFAWGIPAMQTWLKEEIPIPAGFQFQQVGDLPDYVREVALDRAIKHYVLIGFLATLFVAIVW